MRARNPQHPDSLTSPPPQLQITWAASLACSLLAPASLQRVATALGVLSVVLYTKGHLTHDKFLQRVSHHGRRHLVFVVGLCAAILAFTGTDLLLVEASARPPAASGHAVCPVPGPHSPPQGQWHATAVALACLLVAAMSAHGVAGHVLHGGGARRSGGWHFFQPFKVRSGHSPLAPAPQAACLPPTSQHVRESDEAQCP